MGLREKTRRCSAADGGIGANTIISLDLPLPPSTNRIWRSSRGKVHKSAEYVKWEKQAQALFMTQKRNLKKITGQFHATFIFNESMLRPNSDCNNRDKAALDFAVAMNLIEDDSIKYSNTWRIGPRG